VILADTSNEELTPEKIDQYNNVSCSFMQFTYTAALKFLQDLRRDEIR